MEVGCTGNEFLCMPIQFSSNLTFNLHLLLIFALTLALTELDNPIPIYYPFPE